MRQLARHRSTREAEGLFVLDAPGLIAEALERKFEIEMLYVEDQAHDDLAHDAASAGVSVERVPVGAIQRWKASDLVTPQGAVAVVKRPAPAGAMPGTDFALVLVDVGDPGNAGTLIRTAEAAGVGAVLFCGGSVDPYNPKCVRASAGSILHVPVVSGGNPVEVVETVGAAGLRRFAATARGGESPERVDLTGPVALVLGGEARGLPDEVVDGVDACVTIPMTGDVESLNVAMAGTVLCFEVARQRRGA